jgi:hypothetical protein
MILTVDELREHVTTALEDDALQRLLDAAEAEIVRYAGDPGAAVEILHGSGRYLTLDRPAESITSITEAWGATSTTLSASDWLLYPSGLVLERLTTGPNGRSSWWRRVTVTYTPRDDEALREKAQIDLVNLALNYNPGGTMEVDRGMDRDVQPGDRREP